MDHGGTTIYAKSLIDTFAADLVSNLYGNPHSASTPAKLSGQLVDDTRERTLRFFGADPEHFDLIFVANATAAIKLVMDSFKDLANQGGTTVSNEDGGFWYGYHVDSHNSLVGVRECSDSHYHVFSTDSEVDQWLAGSSTLNQTGKLGLFAYPGQSNMTGRRLPLRWSGQLRHSTHISHRDTYTLLDAAALATTSPLHGVFKDPSSAPDFTALSFYKIFGFPDLGGLIVRKGSGRILQYRRYFGGGTVNLVTVLGAKPWHESRPVLHESLEDGTLPFHSIIALKAAIETHERLYGTDPMSRISKHTNFLSKRLYDALSSLRHANGAPAIKIYMGASGHSTYGDATTQGSTVSFNVLREDGTYIPYTSAVERAANKQNIFVRSGQLCNPGGIATHLEMEKWHVQRLFAYGHRCGGHEASGTEIYLGRPTGMVRVSMGAMTTMDNVDTLMAFLKEEYVVESLGLEKSLMTLEESISLVIRANDIESLSDKVEIPETRSEDDSAVEDSQGDLKGYEIVPRSYSSSTTHVNLTSPSTEEKKQYLSSPTTEERKPYLSSPNTAETKHSTIHITSVQGLEMLKSQIIIRSSTRVGTVQKKEENLGLKKFLSSKGKLKRSTSTLALT
jgi:molybdenum cofactor sulfurtransferase